MNINVLNIEEKEDGGAILEIELDQEFLHVILQDWLSTTLRRAAYEIPGIAPKTPELLAEEGLGPESNPSQEEAPGEPPEFPDVRRNWEDPYEYYDK